MNVVENAFISPQMVEDLSTRRDCSTTTISSMNSLAMVRYEFLNLIQDKACFNYDFIQNL
jgi:hypothetical protein